MSQREYQKSAVLIEILISTKYFLIIKNPMSLYDPIYLKIYLLFYDLNPNFNKLLLWEWTLCPKMGQDGFFSILIPVDSDHEGQRSAFL